MNNNDFKIEINLIESNDHAILIEGYIRDSNNIGLANKLIKLVKVRYSNKSIKEEIITSCISNKLGFYHFNKEYIEEDDQSIKITI